MNPKGKRPLSALFELKTIGKDRFAILLLMGVLLVVVCIPSDRFMPKKHLATSESQSGDAKRREEHNAEDADDFLAQDSRKDAEKSYREGLERELEEVLCCMKGVGALRVFLTIASYQEHVVEKNAPYIRNNTNETDAEGGNRTISEMHNEEETVYIQYADGAKEPFVKKEMTPVVEGVLVVAQGGEDAQVRENITQALMALFGLDEHKIKVIPMKNER